MMAEQEALERVLAVLDGRGVEGGAASGAKALLAAVVQALLAADPGPVAVLPAEAPGGKGGDEEKMT